MKFFSFLIVVLFVEKKKTTRLNQTGTWNFSSKALQIFFFFDFLSQFVNWFFFFPFFPFHCDFFGLS